MMTNTNTTAALVSCNKCDGAGYIRAFDHVAAGRCFACGGAGQVEPGCEHAVASSVSTAKTLSADISGRACTLTIYRHGAGFEVYITEIGGCREQSGGCGWFDLAGGRVVGMRLSNGCGWFQAEELASILTAAHRARVSA